MAYVVKRSNGFSGYYRDDNGKRRSVGVFATKREAHNAAIRAESGVRLDPNDQGAMSLADFAGAWLRKADPDVMPNTLRGYEWAFRTYILPVLGERPVASLTRRDVETLLSEIRVQGQSEHQLAQVKAALGSCLRSLVPDVLTYNPTHGVKIHKPPPREFDLIRPDEVSRIVETMPGPGAALFTRFLAATGARFGEAAEIRVKDLNFRSNDVRISRRVVDLIRKDKGARFQVVPGTKAGRNRARTVGVPTRIMELLRDWIRSNELGPDDLVFPSRLVNPYHRSVRPPRKVSKGETFVVGNRSFQHGTAYGYSGGGCRCPDCTEALRVYRLSLREKPKAAAEHLSNNSWNTIWRAAVAQADLGWFPRSYDLRHAFATNLLASGVNIHEVKELMGHRRVETTLIYLHRVESQRSMARDAIDAFVP